MLAAIIDFIGSFLHGAGELAGTSRRGLQVVLVVLAVLAVFAIAWLIVAIV